MSKTAPEFARELDAAIAEHVQALREVVDPLVDAYRALESGGTPPSLTAMFGSVDVESDRTRSGPKPPKAKPAKRKPARPTEGAASAAQKQQIVHALSVTDKPLAATDVMESTGVSRSQAYRHLNALAAEGIIFEAAEGNPGAREAARYMLEARRAEWEDPETVDDDDQEEEEERGATVAEPDDLVADPDAGDDETGAAAQAEHESAPGIIGAGMSARVRKAMAASDARALAADDDVESDARPSGEKLLRLVVEQLDGVRLKPRDVARQMVLPAAEIAQCFRVARDRAWIEQLDDGTFTAIPGAMPAVNGHDHAAVA